MLYGIFGEDVDASECASPLALARNEDVAKQIADILNGTIAQLAAVTAERDALKAQLDAVPVQHIDFYFYHTNEELMMDADIAGNPEAMTQASILIGDWLEGLRKSRR